MTDNNDQLATLGQQVIDSLLATYNPDGDPELALAILPGQVLDSGLVQGGVVNPLPVSQWLHDQYDDPMLLRLADGRRSPSPWGAVSQRRRSTRRSPSGRCPQGRPRSRATPGSPT